MAVCVDGCMNMEGPARDRLSMSRTVPNGISLVQGINRDGRWYRDRCRCGLDGACMVSAAPGGQSSTMKGRDMSNLNSARLAFGFVVFALVATMALAQAPVRPPYGNAVNLETAKKIAAGAMAEAKKQNWNVAVAIVDNHGMLIYYEMKDDTQTAAADISVEKARTAATWRRPSKEFE